MLKTSLVLAAFVALAAPQTPRAFAAQENDQHAAEHTVEFAVAGTVERVDKDAKTLVLKTAEGAEETFEFTEHTAVRALKATGRGADDVARTGVDAMSDVARGSEAIVVYTMDGTKKVATSVDHGAKDVLHTIEGGVVRLDHAAKTVVVETEEGVEEVFRLGERGVVDAGTGLVDATEWTGREFAHGAEVVVHYTEEGGEKVIYLLRGRRNN